MTRQQVANSLLLRDTARANLLVNGGLELWQRGNGPFTTNTVYAADRWSLWIDSGNTISVTRDTTNQDTGSTVCAAVAFTYGGTGGINHPHFQQLLYPADQTQLVGRTVSFSVRVRTTTANAVRAVASVDGGTTWQFSVNHSGGGTYQTLTVPNLTPVNGIVFAGIIFSASCTAYVDNAMLVVGTVSTDYVPLHTADDLARCLRYYETFGAAVNFPQIKGIATAGGQSAGISMPFAVKKAVTPTITVVGTFVFVNVNSGPTSYGPSYGGIYVQISAAAAGEFTAYSNNSGYFVAEANP